jgi:tellurite resistance protein TehA-like permease
VSCFLPIGPLGQGGAGIIQLGVVAKDINYITPEFASVLHGMCVLTGLFMWGYAVLWIVFAVVTVASKFPRLKFAMAWWGFTFPLGFPRLLPSLTPGTFALLCTGLADELHVEFFSILATIVTAVVLILWCVVATKTTIEGVTGRIFYAPCLGKLGPTPPEEKDPQPPSSSDDGDPATLEEQIGAEDSETGVVID